MANRLDLAMREVGVGERNKDRECRQRSPKEPTAEIAGYKGMRSWGKGSLYELEKFRVGGEVRRARVPAWTL